MLSADREGSSNETPVETHGREGTGVALPQPEDILDIDGQLAAYVAAGTLLAVVIAGLMWRMRRHGTDVSPVSEQWLAERRTHRDRD